MNIAIFVSGTGSNMQAILRACKDGILKSNISLVISNNPYAPAIEKAKKFGIETKVINHKDFGSREDFEKEILEVLKNYPIDLICLAGFMRIFSSYFSKNCKIPVINIHPSLLPKFKGANAIRDAFETGEKETGCTIHYVTEELDSGPVILQKSLKIKDGINFEELKEEMHKLEHPTYIEAIKLLEEKML